MKTVSLVALSVAVVSLGCSDLPVAPNEGLESVQAQVVNSRVASDNEYLPNVTASSIIGGIVLHVTTHQQCGTIVTAAISKDVENHVINVVSHVGGNPLANCVPFEPRDAVDYDITITNVGVVKQRVNVFDAIAGRDPAFIGSMKLYAGGEV